TVRACPRRPPATPRHRPPRPARRRLRPVRRDRPHTDRLGPGHRHPPPPRRGRPHPRPLGTEPTAMTPYYDDGRCVIYHGDCRDVLPDIPPVDVVITDPPYSTGRAENEFAATGNIAVSLHMASLLAPTMIVFGT